MESATILEISKKVDFHSYMTNETAFDGSNDKMVYARGEHTQLNIG